MSERPTYQTDALIAEDIEAYLEGHQHKTMLRFITCGSVDDGKSTLIGRLLYDSKMIFDDQLSALEADSKRVGTQGQEIDFALLVDGLAAEREQGITIDVAYRFFTTERRKFIVADCPGHEQYTRNMVTGASTADLAVILIDARKGVLVQTRRHSYLCHLLGIRHFVLAVNKMDLVDYSQARFDEIVADYATFATSIGVEGFTAIPISGFKGDNVTDRSANTPWYSGLALINHLETVSLERGAQQAAPLRLPVQWVNRPNLDFRGFAGQISSGIVRPGDAVRVLPSGRTTTVARVVAAAVAGVPPEIMGIGPAPAIRLLLARTGLKLSDIGRFEINEAQGAQTLAVGRELGLDLSLLNVNGGAIALGHPLAATGVRLTITLARELARSGKRYGISSACVGGGQGIALLIENPNA